MTLVLERLGVPFGDTPGLRSVSLEVSAGERVALIGASGAGKTSLLRAIAGLGRVDAGSVRIDGVDVTRTPAERRDAVYLQQTPLLFPHMTVGDNIAFPLRLRGVGATERRRRTDDVLAAVRLDGFAARMPHTLSGGQRRRAALARAVVARPPVLLLDEPLTALDPSLRAEVRDALLAVHREYGPALLLVTHDLDDAALIADRIGVLLGGRLAQLAAPADLLTLPASIGVARFLGGFVELRGELQDEVFHSPVGAIPVGRKRLRNGPATLVIRRDAVAVGETGIPAQVRSVRALAAHMQVAVSAGDVVFDITAGAGAAPRPGDQVRLAFEPAFISLFEAP